MAQSLLSDINTARLCLLRCVDGLGLDRKFYHETLETYFRFAGLMGKRCVEVKLAATLCYLGQRAGEPALSQAAVSRSFVVSQSAVGEATRTLKRKVEGV